MWLNNSNPSKLTLQDRVVLEVNRLKDEARALPHGPVRDAMIKKARAIQIASHQDGWSTLPGPQAPG